MKLTAKPITKLTTTRTTYLQFARRILTIVLPLAFSPLAMTQVDGVEYNWNVKKSRNGIKVSTSVVAGSKYKAVLAEMDVDAKLSSLVALVLDNSACPEWDELCREAKIIEKLSETENYIYTYNDLPFPVSDRDVVAKEVWTVDPVSGKVSMTSTATKGILDKTKAIRIENAMSQWHFTPLENGKVRVHSFAHIDPNGPTPAWITNMMLVDSPYKLLKKMRKIVKSGRYDETKIPFLHKPQ